MNFSARRSTRAAYLALLPVLLLGAGLALAGCGEETAEGAPNELSAADSAAAQTAAALGEALPAPPARVLVLQDTSDAFGQRCYRQTAHALHYAKYPFDAYDLGTGILTSSDAADSLAGPPRPDAALADSLTQTFHALPGDPSLTGHPLTYGPVQRDSLPPLSDYTAILTTTEYLWKLDAGEAHRLRRYVAEGGGLAVLQRAWNDSLSTVFGASPSQPEPAFREVDEQLSFEREIVAGAKGLTLPSERQTFYDFAPDSSVRASVFLRADSSSRPAAWRLRHGQGRVVYWNNALLAEKRARGLVTQSLVLVQPRAVRPMAGWAAVFLDDFPAPAPEQKLEPIRSEFDLSPAAFYAERWYPDMRRLASDFGVRYTAGAVFSYEDYTRAPFRFSNWLGSRLRVNERPVHYAPWMSRQIARTAEVALHGYNHQPLVMGNWPGPVSMIRSLDMSQRRWRVDVGAEMNPRVYVPPRGMIDSVGLSAVQMGAPSVGVVAGDYEGDATQGGDREFGAEPWAADLFTLPRNTSGYRLTASQKLQMLSLLHTLGAWNHALRPDAVYEQRAPRDFPSRARDSTRTALPGDSLDASDAPLRWRTASGDEGGEARRGLYDQFRQWLAFASENYPWLRYVTASEAAGLTQQYLRVPLRWTRTDGAVAVRAGNEADDLPLYLTLYAEEGQQVATVEGGSFVETGALAFVNYHIIRMERPVVRVQFEEEDREAGSEDETVAQQRPRVSRGASTSRPDS